MTVYLLSCSFQHLDQLRLLASQNDILDAYILTSNNCNLEQTLDRILPLFPTLTSRVLPNKNIAFTVLFEPLNNAINPSSVAPILPRHSALSYSLKRHEYIKTYCMSASYEVYRLLAGLFCGWKTKLLDHTPALCFSSLPGAEGWDSFADLFDTLNNTINWCMLRNHEYHLTNSFWENDKDLDLLSTKLPLITCSLNAYKRYGGKSSFFTYVNGKLLLLDLREIGDKYYDPVWCTHILERSQMNENLSVPLLEDQFYLLLYHSLLQKPFLSAKYKERLIYLSNTLGLDYVSENLRQESVDNLLLHLDEFLYANQYTYTYTTDCYVNKKNLAKLSTCEDVWESPLLVPRLLSLFNSILARTLRRILPQSIIRMSSFLTTMCPPICFLG